MLICRSWLFVSGQYPDNLDFSFRRISPVGGFTYGAISSIAEDGNGFIWFGTTHGLYRYNSVEVQKFINNPLDSTTIPSNSIRAIFCDKSGAVWIGTTHGVSVYDNQKDIFLSKQLQDASGDFLGNNIQEIFKCDDKKIYLLSAIMLGEYDIAAKQFRTIFTDNSIQENFTSAASDSTGKIWIGGSRGTVWLVDPKDQQVRVFCKQRNEQIGKIFPDDSGIWIGYDWVGLDFIGLNGSLVAHYGNSPEDLNRIHHNRVRDIYKDDSGRIWVSTYKGISIIDHGRIINMLPQEISGLPYNSIYKIFRDSKNGIWMGTWSGGLAYRSDFDNRFIHTRKDPTRSETDRG